MNKKCQTARCTTVLLTALCGAAAVGCGTDTADDNLAEIVTNLERAGFPADDTLISDGKVYVGRDAEVSLAASREMLEPGGSSKEQYRTANVVGAVTKICVNGPAFTGNFGNALDLAIENYNQMGLRFSMARSPANGCSFTINAQLLAGAAGGVAGFPSGGLPFPTVTIFDGLATYSTDVIEHVITHELGHTVGLRHSDFFDRSISCGGGTVVNEGDGGVGAIHLPGTPTTAAVGASIMNSCFRSNETGEVTASDRTAFLTLYPANPEPNPPTACATMVAGQSLGVGHLLTSCDRRFQLVLQGDGNLVLYKNGAGALWSTLTGGQSAHYAVMQSDGNFVLYSTAQQALWNSETFNAPGAVLALQDDGNLVIYRNGVPLWNSGTGGN